MQDKMRNQIIRDTKIVILKTDCSTRIYPTFAEKQSYSMVYGTWYLLCTYNTSTIANGQKSEIVKMLIVFGTSHFSLLSHPKLANLCM